MSAPDREEAPKVRSYRDVLANIGAIVQSAREEPTRYDAQRALALVEATVMDGLDGDMVEDEAIDGMSRLIFDPEDGEDVQGKANVLLYRTGRLDG